MTIFDDNFWWQFLMPILMTILMTIFDDKFWWQFLDDNFFGDLFSTCDLWYLRHWLQYWQLRTSFHNNLCYLTSNCDTGQYLQFLRYFCHQHWGKICWYAIFLVKFYSSKMVIILTNFRISEFFRITFTKICVKICGKEISPILVNFSFQIKLSRMLDVSGAGCPWVLDVSGAGCPRVLDVSGCWMSWVLDVWVLDVSWCWMSQGAGCPGCWMSGCWMSKCWMSRCWMSVSPHQHFDPILEAVLLQLPLNDGEGGDDDCSRTCTKSIHSCCQN